MYAPLAVLFCAGVAGAFLFHDENFKSFPENGIESYGYSVMLQKGTYSKLIVGSPLDEETGSIFVIDIESGSKKKFTPNVLEQSIPKNWLFGTAMDGGESIGESVMVCQPRYTLWYRTLGEDNYFTNGGCYVFPNINDTEVYQELKPISNLVQFNSNKYYHAFGQAGLSISFVDKHKEFIIGAPGISNWAGGAVRIIEEEVGLPPQTRSIDERKQKSSRRQRQQLSRSEKQYVEYRSDKVFQLEKKLSEFDYGGYSVACGEFKKGTKYFVVGAPRSHDLRGSVVYIDTTENNAVHPIMGPDQIGSYFGSALCVADVNGDGLEDLLIGAPMQKGEKYDEGFVYQYMNGGKADFSLLSSISTKKAGSRFGTAMSNLGKITLDNFDSVAISSPYEGEGKGAVYIYVGTKEGLKFSQRLEAAANAMGFGISLSRPVDINDNQAIDIAIGAYKSRSSYVYFGRPVFYYEISYDSNARLYSHQENKPFNVSYCVNVVEPRLVKTNITVIFDNRLQNRQTSTLREINGKFCEEITATLHENLSNMVGPISIEVFVEEEVCPKCPVSSPSFTKSLQYLIPFLFNCGDDQICTPDFVVTCDIDRIITVGSNEDTALVVNIENKGEYAYICKLQLESPADVAIKSASKDCNNNNCILINPLQTTDMKVFNLDFSNPTSFADSIEFKVIIDCLNYTAYGSSVVNLRYKSDVHADGTQQEIIYKNKNTTAGLKSTIGYFITNEGPSPLKEYNFTIRIPVNLRQRKIFDVYEPFIDSTNVDISCVSSIEYATQENASRDFTGTVKPAQAVNYKMEEISCRDRKIECASIECTARRFYKGAHIKITFNVAPDIDPIVQEYSSTFNVVSEIVYELESQTQRKESYIKFRDYEEGTYIPYWAIILGVILGLLVLAAITYLLVRLGFFKRGKYEQMKQEQQADKADELFELQPKAGQSTAD